MPTIEEIAPPVEMIEEVPAAPARRRVRVRRQSRLFGPWEWLGASLLALILLGGLLSGGYAQQDFARALAWFGCAAAGVWALATWAVGRWQPTFPFPAGWVAAFFALLLAVGGLQLIPLPAAMITSLSPAWADIKGSFEASGVTVPAKVPLAVAPEKAMHSINQAVAGLGFFLAAVMIASRRRGAQILLACVIGFSLIEGWWGVVHFLSQGAERARGAVYNPNHHATAVIMGLPAACALLLRLRERQTRYGEPAAESHGDKLLVLFSLLLVAALGWLLSFSRGSMAAAILVLVPWAIIEFRNARRNEEPDHETRGRPHVHRGRPFPALQVLLAGGGVILLLGFAAVFEGFADRIGKQEGPPLWDRMHMWRASLKGLAETNFLGLGLGGAEYAINRHHLAIASRETAIWSHNDYVQLTSELGVAFFIPAMVITVLFFRSFLTQGATFAESYPRRARLLRRAMLVGLLIALVHALVDFHLRIPAISFLSLAMTALLLTRGELLVLHNAGEDGPYIS